MFLINIFKCFFHIEEKFSQSDCEGVRMKKLPILFLTFVAFLTIFDKIMGSTATAAVADERIRLEQLKRRW